MVNETFNAKRFGAYFRYDLRQLWRNNGKSAVILGGMSLIGYLVWVIVSLLFTGAWHGPTLVGRFVYFYLGALALVLLQTRTYGYVTEKKAGQSWLMVPASALEKFLSMMLITLIILPLAYVCSYLLLDAVLCLLDSSCGGSILFNFGQTIASVGKDLSALSEEGFQLNLLPLALPLALQLATNLLYFLLCGLCFRKWKIMGGIGVLMLLEAALVPLLSHLVFRVWTPVVGRYDYGDDPARLTEVLNQVFNYGTFINLAVALLLAGGIYYRIKTLKR